MTKSKSALRALILAGSIAALLAAPSTHAAALYWDGADTGANAQGGAGNWDNALTNWDTLAIAGADSAWIANSTAVFGGTAGTVTLTDNVTGGGLTFNTTGYILASDTGARTLSFAAGDNTILFNNIAAASTSSVGTAGLKLGGTGNVILSTSNPVAAGILTLNYSVTGDHSIGWSGTTTINAGMTLALGGRDLSLSSTSGITLNGGGITLNNTNSTQGAFDRVASVGITSNGGTFNYSNTSGTTQTYAETIGSVDLVRGQLNFVETATMGAGNIQTLTLSGLTRTGASNTSAVTFGSASGLGATNVIKVTGAANTTAGQIIGPWATVGTTGGSQTDYAIYTSGNGTVALASTTLTVPGESGWSSSTTAYRASNTAELLTATRTAAALRYTAGVGAIALGASNFNLETYGVLNGGSALTISSAGTGGLTTPAGGGNLYLTTGTAAITVSAPIKDNGGAVTLVKSGTGTSAATGTLTLSGTNTFTGGVVLNAGTLVTTSNANLGVGGGVTVNGSASWNASTGTNRSITINEGGVLTLTGASNQIYSGLLSGSGALAHTASNLYHFTNAGNSLTGEVTVGYAMLFANIGDSSKTINIGNTNGNGGFAWTGGAKTLAQRVFALNAAGGGFITANGAGALVIEQDLAITGAAGARTLNLQGTNTGANTFSGDIADGTSGGASVVSLSKSGTGTWALGGTNTYTGDTNLLAASGRLVFQGSQSLSPNTTLKFTQTSSSVANVRFLDDGAGTINFNRPIEFGGGNTSQQLGIFVGNNNTANGGATAGATTDSIIQVGAITFTSTAGDTATTSINATGANGYRLQTGTITLNNLVTRTAGLTTTTILNPTTANMTVAAITMGTGNTGIANDGVPVLRLDGTSLANIVTGAISNASDGPGFGSGQALSLQKQGISTWTLQGTNTYTGTTAISVGKLLLSSTGSLHASSAVTVSGGALGGTGTVNGAVTVSSTGGIDLRDNAVGNLTLASTLGITGALGANNLSFDLGNGTGTSDQISVAGTTSVTTTGAAVIHLNQLGGVAGRNATTYTLIGGAGTLDATNFAKFTLATTKAFGQTYALANGGAGGDLQLTTTNVTAATPAAFWAGGGNNWSTTTNWRDTVAGAGAVAGAPDYETNVTFSTTTPVPANLTTNVLDVDFDINSLTLTNASGNVTIGGTRTLTIEAAAVNGNALGNGIDSQKTTGTNTISSKVALASSQTWTVASGGTLTVSGVVSDFGGGYSLTKAGLGSLNLSGANTYSGATNITAGVLRLDTATASLANTSSINITSGASLFLRSVTTATFGAGQSLTLNGTGATGSGALVVSTAGTTTWNGPVSLGSDSLVLQGGSTTLNIGGAVSLAANTLTVQADGSNSATISGAISGSGGLTKTGTSTLILSGANTYTGTTAVNAGTLSLNPSSNFLGGVLLASSAVTISQGATLQFNPATVAKADSSGYSLASPITLTGGAGTATMRFGGNDFKYVLSGGVTGQSSVAQTLALFQGGVLVGNGDRQDIVVSGALADGASGGTLAVTVDFAGSSTVGQNAFVNLTGQSTFTGNLIVNNSKLMNGGTPAGAWLTIGGERWVGSGTVPGSLETVGTGSLGSGGVYNGNITINTGNGTSGTGITTLSFLSSANQTLGGTISGAGNLRQDGTGTLTLTGTNGYTGTTVISSGILSLGSGGTTGRLTATTSITNNGNLTINRSDAFTQASDLGAGVAITGTGSFTQAGAGTTTLTAANTYTGATTVGTALAGAANIVSPTANGGSLVAGAVDVLKSTSGIAVNNGGTLLLAGAGTLNRVNDSAGVTLGTTGGTGVGGTIARSGTASEGSGAVVTGGVAAGTNADGFGSLTLSSNSTLDFASGNVGTMVFAGFTPGAFTLNISGYSNSTFDGSLNSGTATDDRLIFNQIGGLTAPQLASINFGGGSSAGQVDLGDNFFEVGIVPVPEPTAVLSAFALLGLAGYRERRRLTGLRARARKAFSDATFPNHSDK